MSKLLTKLVASCLFLLFVCISISAQSSTATLSGTIEDENGAVIPGAKITVTHDATAQVRHATTNDSGSFSIPLLPPGEYTVLVEREGFTRVQLTNIVLNVGDQKAVQVQLKVGDVSTTVEVRSDETLINTSPAVTNTIDRTFVQNLPLNGRSFQSLILLAPGVTTTASSGTDPGQFSVNGQRGNANYFTVDGVSANTGAFITSSTLFGRGQSQAGVVPGLTTFGGTSGLVSVDALEEFRIQTSTYSAEFGRQPGGQVSLVTRSGTNQFHGSLFDYVRNEVFDANDWFANAASKPRPNLRQNQFGGTFSGPVMFPNFGDGGPKWYNGRNRTFFFFSYEGVRLVLPQVVATMVPSLRVRAEAAPDVRALLNAFPLPNGPELLNASRQPTGLSRFTGVYSDPSTLNATSIRVDHRLNPNLTLFVRYNHAPSSTATRSESGLNQITENEITSRSFTVGSAMMLTPKLSNELKLNVTRDRSTQTFRVDDFGGAVPSALRMMIPDRESKGTTLRAQVAVQLPAGIPTLSDGPGDRIHQRQLNIIDNLSLVKGDHQLKFGVDYRRLAPIFSDSDYRQIVFFTSETQMRAGTAGRLQIVSTRESRPVFVNTSVYGQDTWKPTPRLTLDFGVRWELNPAPSGDAERLIRVIGLDNLPTATLAALGGPIYKTDYRAFAPRVGAAYQLSANTGWERVIRGGFGVYYDVGSGQAVAGFGLFPFSVQTLSLNVPFPIPPSLAVPPPAPVVGLPITSSLAALEPDLKLPYSLQWNVAFEQLIGQNQSVTVSYVASTGRRLLVTQVLNQLVAGRRPNPNFGQIFFTSNRSTSDYDSLQLQFQRRLTHGIQALVNYTWSHAIDDVSTETTFGVLDRGNASFDVRHNFSSAITYNLPGSSVGGFVGKVIGNWSLDGIIHAQSGAPVDLRAGTFVREDGTQFSVRPDLVSGQPLYIADPSVAGGRRFNSAAFQQPPVANGVPVRQGTLGRNVMSGLPLYQVDLGLRRQFKITERINLQLKAEAFNLFNHPNFGGFGVNVLVPSTLGVPTQMLGRSLGGLSALYQIGGPRSLQFSARIGF